MNLARVYPLFTAAMFARVAVGAFVSMPDAVGHGEPPADESPQAVARMDCIAFSSRGRLAEGTDFRLALPKGLYFHLSANGASGWGISIRTLDGEEDFVWVVSPPFQTAPHLQVGAAYGVTARESAQFERRLRFVLTSEDYDRARRVYEQWRNGESTAEEANARRQQFRLGTLSLKVTNFSLREDVRTGHGVDVDAFNWIEFEGEACVPR